MRTFECTCGNRLYFENTRCLTCGHDVGWCPACRTISPLLPGENGAFTCGRPECHVKLWKCANYANENVCNWCWSPDFGTVSPPLCGSCRLTEVIPDLSIEGNRKRWFRLEVAKRRLLYELDLPSRRTAYGGQ
jgi:hypothetical protein